MEKLKKFNYAIVQSDRHPVKSRRYKKWKRVCLRTVIEGVPSYKSKHCRKARARSRT